MPSSKPNRPAAPSRAQGGSRTTPSQREGAGGGLVPAPVPAPVLKQARKPKPTALNRAIADRLIAWFATSARPLPWRTSPRDPYHALVAEAMLQQTQVSRVIEPFTRFITRLPTLAALARAAESDVLALWSGLGYYRRARSLHAAARLIVERFDGTLPSDPESLLQLPGVGRYTAGSIASIVFGLPAPIVDGNVARVLLRLDGLDLEPTANHTIHTLWTRAEQLVTAAHNPAAFNEGLMELGATVCLPPPATPACERCPLRTTCRAHADNTTDRIPRPKRLKAPTDLFADTLVLTRQHQGATEVLLHRRQRDGLWGGLWHPPTVESPAKPPGIRAAARQIGAAQPRLAGAFTRQLSHRTVHFRVYAASPNSRTSAAPPTGLRWVRAGELHRIGTSSACRAVLQAAGVFKSDERAKPTGS